MAYAAWSVVFGETPSAAKWNILGTNDAAFNSGGGVLATGLDSAAISLGYAQITSDFTDATSGSDVDVTGLSVTVTTPSGGRRIKITGYCPRLLSSHAAGTLMQMHIKESTTQLQTAGFNTPVTSYGMPISVIYTAVVSAGSHTYKLAIKQGAAGTMTVSASATLPSFIFVQAA